jgi:hypothetical protein
LSFGARFAAPSAEELRALARKYETIAVLRRDRAAGGAVAPRPVLRALAREFPGALKELDRLTMEQVEYRYHALSAAGLGGPVEAWMRWMVAYHATMRAALFLKARIVASAPPLSDELVQEAAAEGSRRCGMPIDEAFVRAVASPPAGRLNRAVFERLGEAFAERPEVMREALFPSLNKADTE